MTRSNVSSRRGRVAATALSLVLFGSLIPLASVSAATPTLTAASGGSMISADNNGATGTGSYTALTGPVIAESAAGDLGNGTIILTPPAGFQFNPAAGSASVNGGCTPLAVAFNQSTSTITITGAPSTTNPCTITVSGLQVRAINATFAGSGNITNTGTAGTNAPTPGLYGPLTEIAGAPQLTFTSGSINNTTGGVALTPSPGFHDQDAESNNRVGDPVTLRIKPGTGTTGATLACTTNPANTGALGNVTFN
ncbi:MAG TPA: hypothetical protein VNF73_03095, partial [Candidatus Saccharimonadales bacterium]|nr:hypothetical protein [Candidatus Saccharimonadales bacterium]